MKKDLAKVDALSEIAEKAEARHTMALKGEV